MLIFLWSSGLAIAVLLTVGVLRRHRRVPLWRHVLFYAALACLVALFGTSWQVTRAASAPVDPARAEAGRQLFEASGCSSCHSLGQGLVFGPDLLHAADKYGRNVLVMWMVDSNEIYRQFGRRPLAAGNPEMPSLGLPEADARLIAEYLMHVAQQAGE
jgi:mono/diheme cytochrome c family protein